MLPYYYTLTILISFCSLFSLAQNTATITGKVLDKKGAPVPFAYVVSDTLNIGAMCGEDGSFKIERVPAGKRRITAHTMGYLPQTKNITLTAGQAYTLSFDLAEETKNLDEVVLKGQSETQQIRESGFAVNTIETKEFALQSIQTNELLDRSVGVRIRQTGGLGSNVQYNLNGLSGNSVRIFIDGIPISNYGPSFSLNSIPASMIERIEVYKGVVPAHLSSDALGGVINVILKKSIQNTFSASYSFGSFNTHQANINGAYRNNKNGFTARASGFYNYTDNSYKVWGEKVYVTNLATHKVERITARRFHDSYRSYGGKLDIGFTNVKWADKFLIGTVLSDMNTDIQHGATMEIVYGNRRATQNTHLYSLEYGKQDFLIKKLDLTLSSTYSNLNRQTIDTVANMYTWRGERLDYKWASGAEGSSPTLQTNKEKNHSTRANISYRLAPNHKLNLNYMLTGFTRDQDDPMLSQIERDLVDTRYLTKSVVAGAYESQLFKHRLKSSIFFKHYSQSVSLKDRVRQSNGNISQYVYDNSVSLSGYGIAMSYKLFPRLMLTGSMEKAMRLPTENEIFGNNMDNIDPSFELKPEQSQNINLGLNADIVKLHKHQATLITNFFYRNTSDMIRQGIPTQVSETFRFENLLSVISKGIDFEVLYNYERKLFITSGLSILDARFNTEFDEEGKRYQYYQNRLRNEPYFTSNTNIRYYRGDLIQKNSQTSLYYNFGYVHTFFRDWESLGKNNKPTIATQIVNDIGVAYTLPNRKLTFSFDAKNIFNHQVFDNWALQKPGRAFYAKITYQII